VTGKDGRGQPIYNRRQLVLTSPLVPEPIHYRYAWGRNPLANLQLTGNKDLPVATQRSDSWTMDELPLDLFGDDTSTTNARAQQGKILQALRLEDTRRRLREAELFIEENQKRYEELEKAAR
jgi:sialate O-acetylesterase